MPYILCGLCKDFCFSRVTKVCIKIILIITIVSAFGRKIIARFCSCSVTSSFGEEKKIRDTKITKVTIFNHIEFVVNL